MQTSQIKTKRSGNVRRFLKKQSKTKWLSFDPVLERVPPVVEETVSFLEKRALDEDGLFRISGDPSEIATLKTLFLKRTKQVCSTFNSYPFTERSHLYRETTRSQQIFLNYSL